MHSAAYAVTHTGTGENCGEEGGKREELLWIDHKPLFPIWLCSLERRGGRGARNGGVKLSLDSGVLFYVSVFVSDYTTLF